MLEVDFGKICPKKHGMANFKGHFLRQLFLRNQKIKFIKADELKTGPYLIVVVQPDSYSDIEK